MRESLEIYPRAAVERAMKVREAILSYCQARPWRERMKSTATSGQTAVVSLLEVGQRQRMCWYGFSTDANEKSPIDNGKLRFPSDWSQSGVIAGEWQG